MVPLNKQDENEHRTELMPVNPAPARRSSDLPGSHLIRLLTRSTIGFGVA
jgi:hypothetical protein